MIIYLLQETVDLGSHTQLAFINKYQAEASCVAHNIQYKKDFPLQTGPEPFWIEEIAVVGEYWEA